MITVRRAEQREYVRRHARESWLSFKRDGDPLAAEFRSLNMIREGRLPPQSASRATSTKSEIITYVREGSLAFEDALGRSGLIQAGEFQRMTAGGVHYEQTNTSPTKWAHVFQVSLRTSDEIEPGHEQRRFSAAERRGGFCLIASPTADERTLQLHQDACLYSSLLSSGQHAVHVLGDGRTAWLHIVEGSARCTGVAMHTGDGAAVVRERAVSLTASDEVEVLLLDLATTSPVRTMLKSRR